MVRYRTLKRWWWEEIGRTTLTSSATEITVASLPARRYLKVIYFVTITGGTANLNFRFNGDSGSNYCTLQSNDFGAVASFLTRTAMFWTTGNTALFRQGETEIINISNQEKLCQSHFVSIGGDGEGVAPAVVDGYHKWDNKTDLIESVTGFRTTGTGNYDVGSTMIVLGHD